MDFTNLNEACPEDSFSMPRIDQMVEVIAGHELLTFMDAYSGYNQIPMFHCIHHRSQTLLLQIHAFRFEECRGDITKVGVQDLRGAIESLDGSLHQ